MENISDVLSAIQDDNLEALSSYVPSQIPVNTKVRIFF